MEPEFKGERPTKIEAPGISTEEEISLRITAPSALIEDEELKDHVLRHPEHCLKLLQCSLKEVKTNGWAGNTGAVEGNVVVPKSEMDGLLKLSGNGGVFVQQLRRDVIYLPDVSWLAQKKLRAMYDGSTAKLFLIGGIQSPKVKFKTRGAKQKSSKCDISNSDWGVASQRLTSHLIKGLHIRFLFYKVFSLMLSRQSCDMVWHISMATVCVYPQLLGPKMGRPCGIPPPTSKITFRPFQPDHFRPVGGLNPYFFDLSLACIRKRTCFIFHVFFVDLWEHMFAKD